MLLLFNKFLMNVITKHDQKLKKKRREPWLKQTKEEEDHQPHNGLLDSEFSPKPALVN